MISFIIQYLVKITNLEKSIVEYSLTAIVSSLLCISLAIVLCSLFNGTMFSVLFILIFTPLKMQFKSFHCKSLLSCITTYSICILLNYFLYQHLLKTSFISFPLTSFSVVLFLLFTIKDIKQKQQTFWISLVYILLFMLSAFFSVKLHLIFFLSFIFESLLICVYKLIVCSNSTRIS